MPSYVLKVNGQTVSSALRHSLVRYELNYDEPARLVVQFHNDFRVQPFACDAIVEFLVDGTRRFVGLFNPPRPYISAANERFVEYTAVDLADWAGRMVPNNEFDAPSFALPTGLLQSAVNAYLAEEQVIEMLEQIGIDTAVEYTAGAGLLQVFPVSLDNVSIDAAMRQMAANAAGVACFLDCSFSPPRYHFVPLFGTPTHDLVIDETRLAELDIQRSIEGRCGAVQTLAGSTQGQAEVQLDAKETLVKNWPDTVGELGLTPESQWSLYDFKRGSEDGSPSPLANVYREFRYVGAVNEDSPLRAEVQTWDDAENDANDEWREVDIINVDFENKTIMLKEPALRTPYGRRFGRFNLLEPGRAKGAAVRLWWSTSATVAGTINIPADRYPEEGFAGSVVQLAPKRGATVKNIVVPAGVDRATYARQAHAAFSEPIVTGQIQINGAMPDALWAMARRVNLFSTSHGPTGYEAMAAPVKGIRVEFDAGGRAVVELSRDATEKLAGGTG